jgi:hypothetical protein
MNQNNSRDVEEIEDGTTTRKGVSYEMLDWLRTTLHQELQKVREEEGGYAANTYKSFIQYIEEFNEPHTVVRICRTLLSELDQLNK